MTEVVGGTFCLLLPKIETHRQAGPARWFSWEACCVVSTETISAMTVYSSAASSNCAQKSSLQQHSLLL